MDAEVWEGIIAGGIAVVFMLVYIKRWGRRDSPRLRRICIAAYLMMAVTIWSGCFIFYFAGTGRPVSGLFVFHWVSIPLLLVFWNLVCAALIVMYRERRRQP